MRTVWQAWVLHDGEWRMLGFFVSEAAAETAINETRNYKVTDCRIVRVKTTW